MTKFKQFKLGDLFEFSLVQQAKSQKLIPNDNSKNGINYVVQMESSNMISRKVNKQYLLDHNENVENGNAIVIGMALPVVSYQPQDFGGSQLIVLRNPNLNNNGFYISTCIHRVLKSRKYGEVHGIDGCSSIIIQLPVKDLSDEEPDWDYMEQVIKQTEAPMMNALDQWLQNKDPVLSDNEVQSILDRYQKADFKDFRIGDLFEINTPTIRYNANTLVISDKRINKDYVPYVVRTSKNNGIRGFINCKDKVISKENTISLAQDTAEFFYQKYPYCTGDKIKIMSLRHFNLNSFLAQYLIVSIRKAFQVFSWGSSSFNVKIIKGVNIKLPVTTNNEPDYQLMEAYIKVIQQKYVRNLEAKLQNRIQVAKTLI